MKCIFFLNIIIWQCLSFFKLFSCKNQSLLIWWNSLFFLDFCFDCVNWIVWFNFECDCLTKICIINFFLFNLKFSIFQKRNELLQKYILIIKISSIHLNKNVSKQLHSVSHQLQKLNNFDFSHIKSSTFLWLIS